MKTIISGLILSLAFSFTVYAESTKMDDVNKEFNETLSEIIEKSGNTAEIKGLVTKLCKIKCKAIHTAEIAACGPGENTGPLKACRDGANRHKTTCIRGC